MNIDAKEIRAKVNQFDHFTYGEVNVHYYTICKVMTTLTALDGQYRQAFLGAPNREEIERIEEDMKKKFDYCLYLFKGSLDKIRACAGRATLQGIHLLEEAYETLKTYLEAVKEQYKSEGVASLKDRPYTVGVDENVDD